MRRRQKKKTGGRERVCVCVCGCVVERSSDDNNNKKDGRAHRGQNPTKIHMASQPFVCAHIKKTPGDISTNCSFFVVTF